MRRPCPRRADESFDPGEQMLARGGRLEDLHRHAVARGFKLDADGGAVELVCRAPVGTLGLRGSATVGAIAEQDRALSEFLNGRLAPLERLSEEKLAGPGF